jgi:enterochelin esterase family protein
LAGQLHCLQHTSTLLRGNPLGDPHERELYVYTPPGYAEGTRRYPTVMLLAGYASTHRSLLGFDPFEPNIVERFDRLVQRGLSEPAILVLPDAINRWAGSQFLDSSATGPYQSYLVDEIVPFVDAHFRTLPVRESRAVMGRSSGGFGALRLGLDRPECFAVIGSHAGDSAFETSIRPELTAAAIAYDRAGGVSGFCEAFAQNPRSGSFTAIMIVAYAAAYAPLDAGPLPRAALPFDPRTAELDAEVWQRWLAHDPLERLRAEPRALCDMRFIYLDAGDRDEHGLHFGARQMRDLLIARGAPVEHQEFPGGHRGTGHRYETSLPRLVAACAR